VVDELQRGFVDDDEEVQGEPKDRAYWEGRAGKESLALADQLLGILRKWDARLELKYNKWYVGLAREGEPDNFVVFVPTKNAIRLEIRAEEQPELTNHLEEAGLLMSYAKKWNKYRVRLTRADAAKHEGLITDLLKRAFDDQSD